MVAHSYFKLSIQLQKILLHSTQPFSLLLDEAGERLYCNTFLGLTATSIVLGGIFIRLIDFISFTFS